MDFGHPHDYVAMIRGRCEQLQLRFFPRHGRARILLGSGVDEGDFQARGRGSGSFTPSKRYDVKCMRLAMFRPLESSVLHPHMHSHTHTHMHPHMHPQTHTYTHTCIHTHTHTHTHTCRLNLRTCPRTRLFHQSRIGQRLQCR